MEFLPKTLITLMNVVNDPYSNFAWTSYEENGKMRISMMWNNDTSRRKSKATVKRDRRRYEQFLLEKSKSEEIGDSESVKSSEWTDCDNDSTVGDSEDKMDTFDNVRKPCGAPINETVAKQVDDHSTEKLSSSCNDSARDNVKVKNSVHKRTVVKENSVHDGNTQQDSDDSRPERKIPRRSKQNEDKIDKIVMKVSDRRADYLLAFLPCTFPRVVIEHTISQNQNKLVRSGDQYWRAYVKNIDEDFDDVRTTKFMNDDVQEGIQRMEQFVSELLSK